MDPRFPYPLELPVDTFHDTPPPHPRPVRADGAFYEPASGAGILRGRLNPGIYKVGTPSAVVHDQFFDEFWETHAPPTHEVLDCVGDRGVWFSATKKGGKLLELAECALAIDDRSRDRHRGRGLTSVACRRGCTVSVGQDLGISHCQGWPVRSQRLDDIGQGLPQTGKRRALIAAMRGQRDVQPREGIEARPSVVHEIANELRRTAL